VFETLGAAVPPGKCEKRALLARSEQARPSQQKATPIPVDGVELLSDHREEATPALPVTATPLTPLSLPPSPPPEAEAEVEVKAPRPPWS